MTAPFSNPNTSHPHSPEALLAQPMPIPEVRRTQTAEERAREEREAMTALQALMASQHDRVPTENHLDTVYNRILAQVQQPGVARQPGVTAGDFTVATYGGQFTGNQLEHAVRQARDSHFAANAQNIETRHHTGDAINTLERLVTTGNTEALLGLLTASNNAVHERANGDRTTHDRLSDTHGSHVRATALNVAALREHRRDTPLPPRAEKDDPKPPAREDQTPSSMEQWRADVRAHKVSWWNYRNEIGVPATNVAREQLANQANAARVRESLQRVQISEAMMHAIGSITEDFLNERAERVARLEQLEQRIGASMEGHHLGEPMEPDAAAHTATLLAELAQEINNMSPVDELSHTYMGVLVTETTRFQQRRAMTAPGSTGFPRITPDRGVEVETTDGVVTFYEDGSHIRPGDVRRDSDGTEWDPQYAAPNHTEEDDINIEVVRAMSDDDLRDQRNTWIERWETIRSADAELVAAVFAREYSTRLEGRAAHTLAALTALNTELGQVGTTLVAMTANRTTEINKRVAERTKGITNSTLIAQVRTHAQQEVDTEIQRLTDRRRALDGATRGARREALHWREHANQSHYARLWLAVNRPEAGEAIGRVYAGPRGEVILMGGTFNGIQGNWIIASDGRARLVDAHHKVIADYRADGRQI